MSEVRTLTTFDELIRKGILEIGDGYRAKLEELGGTGPLFLRAGLLAEQGIRWNDAERFHPNLARRFATKLGKSGDTIVTTKGNSVGRTGYIPSGAPSFVYSPHLSYWRSLDASKLSPDYLRYWSRSPEFIAQLNAMASSTDMAPYLSLIDQRRLKISLPAIEDQKNIGTILAALDDKIAMNDRIVATVDVLVRAHYVNRCINSYETIRIDELGMLVRDTVSAASLIGNENYIGLEHIPRRRMWLSDWRSAAGVASAKTRFTRGDVLFGKLRPYFHKVGCAIVDGVCSTDIFVIRPKRETLRGWLLAVLSSDEVVSHASAVGDGTRMPRARWGDLAAYQVPWIGAEGAAQFSVLVSSFGDRVVSACAESRALVEFRDTLLPKLISGEIRVRDAERVVEGAT